MRAQSMTCERKGLRALALVVCLFVRGEREREDSDCVAGIWQVGRGWKMCRHEINMCLSRSVVGLIKRGGLATSTCPY